MKLARRRTSNDSRGGDLTDITQPVPVLARTLSAITEHARDDGAVRRQDLSVGDRLLVRTRNSTYLMWSLGGDEFAVSGGWFDSHEMSPATIRINGCTYGRSAIRHDVLAAPGLYLEFANNVRTTRIMEVRVERSTEETVLH